MERLASEDVGSAAVLAELAADFSELSAEVHRSKRLSFSGQLGGLFTPGQVVDVRAALDAADGAFNRVQDSADPFSACREAPELLEAAVLATSRPRAICLPALGILQKLLYHGLLLPPARVKAVAALHAVSQSRAHDDDAIRLRLLQICLTTLQLPHTLDSAEAAGRLLAICMRLLGGKHSPTVMSTASATVRQVVTLVYEHAAAAAASGAVVPATPPRAAARPLVFESPGDRSGPSSPAATSAPATPAGRPPAPTNPLATRQLVALTLLHELCRLCRGHASDALGGAAAPPATFMLDVLSDVLRAHVALFRGCRAFTEALREDVCGAVLHVLRSQLEAEAEQVHVPSLRAAVQAAALLVTAYGHLVAARAELLLQRLLAGVSGATHLAQQVLCLSALRSVCLSPPCVYFLHTTFDMKLDHRLRAVTATLQLAADFVVAFVGSTVTPTGDDAEALALLCRLWAQKMHSRHASIEHELAAHVSTGYGGMYIVLLAIDTVTALAHSLAGIADHAVAARERAGSLAGARGGSAAAAVAAPQDASGAPPAAAPAPAPDTLWLQGDSSRVTAAHAAMLAQEAVWDALPQPSEEQARLLADILWRPSLDALTRLLDAVKGEDLVVHILRAIQALTAVSAQLGKQGAMTTCLDALCRVTRSEPEGGAGAAPRLAAPSPQRAPGAGGDGRDTTGPGRDTQTRGAPAEAAAALEEAPPAASPGPPQPPSRGRRQEPVAPLSAKNMQAFRALFNVTHAAFESIGAVGWLAVLTALSRLDVALSAAAPPGAVAAAAAASGAGGSSSAAGGADLGVLSTATEQLYAATAAASDATLAVVLDTLAQLSATLGIFMQKGQARCLCLERMADVVVFNRGRIRSAWPRLLLRIRDMAASSDAATRAAAVAALKRVSAALFALRRESRTPRTPPASALPSTATAAAAAAAALREARGVGAEELAADFQLADAQAVAERLCRVGTGDEEAAPHVARGAAAAGPSCRSTGLSEEQTEALLAVSVAQVFSQASASCSDVRYGCLDIVHEWLQARGDVLGAAWPAVLAVLDDVAATQRDPPRSVRLGSECMELTVADLLPLLPRSQLRRALDTQARYVTQSVDVNASYAASLALWRAADTLGRALGMHCDAAAAAASDSASPPVAPGPGPGPPPPPMGRAGSEPRSAPRSGGLLAAAASILSFSSVSLPPLPPGSSAREPRWEAHGAETATGGAAGVEAVQAEGSVSGGGGGGDEAAGQLAAVLRPQEASELLLAVMESAQRIALEPRPQVRTSGVKLLFDVVTRHGVALGDADGRVWAMAMPLLTEVVRNVESCTAEEEAAAAAATTASAAAAVGGGDERLTTPALAPSGPSLTRQWLETLEKALGGCTAYLRVMLTHVMHLPRFTEDWAALLATLQGLVTMTRLPKDICSRKVALAALAFFPVVVAKHAGATATPPSLWSTAWAALHACSLELASPAAVAHVSVRQRFVVTLAATYREARCRFDAESYGALVAAFDRFVACPVAQAQGEVWPHSYPPAVQQAVVDAIPALAPPPAPAQWPVLVAWLAARLVPPQPPAARHAGQNGQEPQAAAGSAARPGGGDEGSGGVEAGGGKAGALSSSPLAAALPEPGRPTGRPGPSDPVVRYAFVALLAGAVSEVYKAMPWDVRAAAFRPLVAAVLPGIEAGQRGGGSGCAEMARSVTRAFCEIAGAGLPAVHVAMAQTPAAIGEDGWDLLCDAFQACLRPHAAVDGTADAAAAADALTATVLDCLADSVLASSGPTPALVKRRLVSILDAGCSTACSAEARVAADVTAGAAAAAVQPGGERLAQLCLRKLYLLCGRGALTEAGALEGPPGHSDIAKIALPVYLARCQAILRACVGAPGHDVARRVPSSPLGCSPTGSKGAGHGLMPGTDLAVCALQTLRSLQLTPAVVDGSLPGSSALRAQLIFLRSLDRGDTDGKDAQVARAHAQGRREQSHLLVVYWDVLACAKSSDRGVREAAVDVLAAMGSLMGLPPSQRERQPARLS